MQRLRMPGDSLYWSPTEGDSDDSLPAKEQYIDPWDLENYAYIREHLESMELSSTTSAPSGSSGEFAEANSNSFYYVPGDHDRRDKQYPPAVQRTQYSRQVEERRGYDSLLSDQENYAAIDELRSLDQRRRSHMYNPNRRRFQEEYESEIEIDPYNEGLIRDNPIFGLYDDKGNFRRVALPITPTNNPKTHRRDRSRSFAYGEYEQEIGHRHRQDFVGVRDLYGRFEDHCREERIMPLYDDVARSGRKPQNFGLSKYGHLKIDYSCSWNNLNKYIKYN